MALSYKTCTPAFILEFTEETVKTSCHYTTLLTSHFFRENIVRGFLVYFLDQRNINEKEYIRRRNYLVKHNNDNHVQTYTL